MSIIPASRACRAAPPSGRCGAGPCPGRPRLVPVEADRALAERDRQFLRVAGLRRGLLRGAGITAVSAGSSSLPRSAEHVARLAQLHQPLERRAHHVVMVRRADRLGQHVLDAARLDDRADRAAGDDAGAVRRRLQQHLPGAEAPEHRVRHRRPLERHADQRLLRRLDALLDRRGHFLRLADAEADHAVAVADDDQRAEAQVLAALDDLGDAADVDDRVLQVQLRRRRFFREFRSFQFRPVPVVSWPAVLARCAPRIPGPLRAPLRRPP